MEKYVAVIQDKEYFFEMKSEDRFKSNAQYVAEKAVRDSEIKTNRKNPVPITVKVYKLIIDFDLGKNPQIKRIFIRDFSVIPPLEVMTENEYNEELKENLQEIPEQFHTFVRNYAWDQGHSAGYEEVINYVQDLVYQLKPAIIAYRDAMYVVKPTNYFQK